MEEPGFWEDPEKSTKIVQLAKNLKDTVQTYKDLEQHQRIHEGFLKNTLPALEQELKQTDYPAEAVEHFLGSAPDG